MRPIEDYALIGDTVTAALVAKDGSIDWLCVPRFDSNACFAALLGTAENGRWNISPANADVRITRQYRENTLILETEFTTPEGCVRLIDFMPVGGDATHIVRIVQGVDGCVPMEVDLTIRFDYGSIVPWVTQEDGGVLRAIAGPDMITLTTPVQLEGDGLTTRGKFEVRTGQRMPFVLTYSLSHLGKPERVYADQALHRAQDYWEKWAAHAKGNGQYSEAVTRSLITLKALTYAPSGGIVAAPTTSLPEHIGGVRNWDYRFCWLRDATLSLLAFMNAGHYDEARAWRDWLMRAVAGSPEQLRIMYGIAGERRLPEWQIPWLAGYGESLPVRIGNAAAQQRQLDVYGEVMDALHQARKGGLQSNTENWDMQRALLDHLETIWREPDEGIWETRGPRQHFTFSKVMAWVAFDRGIKAIEEAGLDGPLERWKKIRADIHETVCARAFNPKIGAFTQAFDSELLDASTLLIASVGFLPHDDKRIVGTIDAVEHKLLRDGFLLRYDTGQSEDGLPAGEGAFLACSFWLADAYVMCGRTDDAHKLFERLLNLRNDVGLLAEEYDPRIKRQVGNFPQAFSHVGLINTAHNLTHATKPSEQRSEEHAEAPR